MKRRNRVCGEYPRTLYRFFKEKKYAEEFISRGKIRAGLISSYRKIECQNRRDESEGEAHYRMPGRVISCMFTRNSSEEPVCFEKDGLEEHHISHGNRIYLICSSLCLENLDQKISRFGAHIVKIHSPVSLAIDIDWSLNHPDGSGRFLVDGRRVEYSKGEILAHVEDTKEYVDLGYIQKPPSFAVEDEFRYCLIDMNTANLLKPAERDYLDFEIGHELQYAELLNIT